MDTELIIAVEGPLLRVTLSRPEKLNALSRPLLAAIGEAFRAHAQNDSLALAVVRGAGDRSFAAGGDLRDLEQVKTLEDSRALFEHGNRAFQAIREFPAPVIAALNGMAIGGGAELAVACDVRIAAAHAKIGFVQSTLNIPTAWGGGADLMAIVGPARGLRLLAEARVLSAHEALDAGLVDAVGREGEPIEALIASFVEPWLRGRPQVMRAFKAMAAARKLGIPRAQSDARDRELFAQAWSHPDHWAVAAGLLDRGTKHKVG